MISQPKGRQTISPGTILVEKSTLLPEPLGLESDLTESGWARVTNNPDRRQIEEKLAAAGWTFFYMAGTIRTIAFGFDRPRMIEAALKRLIATVSQQKSNCLEVDAITMRSFLGVPYVSLSAHSRHIQNGRVFGNDSKKGQHGLGIPFARSRKAQGDVFPAKTGAAA